jgi:hypothetical protein
VHSSLPSCLELTFVRESVAHGSAGPSWARRTLGPGLEAFTSGSVAPDDYLCERSICLHRTVRP